MKPDSAFQPFLGFQTPPTTTNPFLNFSHEEFVFWSWMVSAVQVDVNVALSAKSKDSGGIVTSATLIDSISEVMVAPKQQVGPLVQATEEDQALGRIAYSNLAQQSNIGAFVSHDNTFSFQMNFGGNAYKDPLVGDQVGWFVEFFVAFPTVFTGDPLVPVGAQFSSVPFDENASFSGSILLLGSDPENGNNYVHAFPGYWSAELYTGATSPDPGSIGADAATGSVIIQAATFYDYKNELGQPTYSTSTGARL